jgi:hypothetical protein
MGICLSTRDFLRRRTLPSWAATPTCRRDRVREASLGSTSTSRMVSLCAWVMVRVLGSALYQGHGLDLLSWTVANEAVGLRKSRTSWPSMDGYEPLEIDRQTSIGPLACLMDSREIPFLGDEPPIIPTHESGAAKFPQQVALPSARSPQV